MEENNQTADIGSFSAASYSDGTGSVFAPQEPPKKNKAPGIILLVLGAVLLLGGLGVMFFGTKGNPFGEEESIDIYDATEVDEFVYAPVQYMTDYAAYYESMENMKFYIAIDEEWNCAVVCIHDDDIEDYEEYIDWLYEESWDNPPEPAYIEGYAQEFDRELKELIIEAFEYDFGEGYVDLDNFEEYFGPYYIQVGGKNSAFGMSNIGLALAIVGLVLAVIGAVKLLKKPEQAPVPGNYTSGPIIEEPQGNILLGIVGAVIGAALGGLIWAVIGILGYIVGWVGVLTIVLSYGGYKLLARKGGALGVFISIVLSIAAIFAGHYMAWAWTYYKAMNESIGGFTSLGRSVMELAPYLDRTDGWGDFATDLVKGYGLMLVAGIYFLLANRKK